MRAIWHARPSARSSRFGLSVSRAIRIAYNSPYAAHRFRHQRNPRQPPRAYRGGSSRRLQACQRANEGWIAADPFKGGFRVLITGGNGFERTLAFAIDDDPALIAERVRETLE
jgi:hypothetical protein